MAVNRSITRSIIGKMPKQGGGQLPPFKGALTARHPTSSAVTPADIVPRGPCAHLVNYDPRTIAL